MNTSLINVKNTFNIVKKWIVSSILICSTFGLLYQLGSIYQYQQLKSGSQKIVDTNNILYAIKKSWLITLVNVIILIIVFVNIKYIYILDYSKFITYILLICNVLIVFELIMINIFFPMFAVSTSKWIVSISKSLIIANLNIGLAILLIVFGIIIISCIVVAPLTSYVLVPLYIAALQTIYINLEKKYGQSVPQNE